MPLIALVVILEEKRRKELELKRMAEAGQFAHEHPEAARKAADELFTSGTVHYDPDAMKCTLK